MFLRVYFQTMYQAGSIIVRKNLRRIFLGHFYKLCKRRRKKCGKKKTRDIIYYCRFLSDFFFFKRGLGRSRLSLYSAEKLVRKCLNLRNFHLMFKREEFDIRGGVRWRLLPGGKTLANTRRPTISWPTFSPEFLLWDILERSSTPWGLASSGLHPK